MEVPYANRAGSRLRRADQQLAHVFRKIAATAWAETLRRWVPDIREDFAWLEKRSERIRKIPIVVYLFAAFAALELLWIWRTSPFFFGGAIGETLLSLTAARNYLQQGFLSTYLLSDYVAVAKPSGHPVVYTQP